MSNSPDYSLPGISSNIPEHLLYDAFLEFELLKELPKPQLRAHKLLKSTGKIGDFVDSILPRVNAWLEKYFNILPASYRISVLCSLMLAPILHFL